MLFLIKKLFKSELILLDLKDQVKKNVDKTPFLGPKITIKDKINIYIGVKKKLTNQQALTNKDKKSSLNTWNNKNSFPKNPAL